MPVVLNHHIIMITTHLLLHSLFFTIPLLLSSISALNIDGTTLLYFKHSLLPHQSPLLQNWNQSDHTPCSWSGVTCAPQNGPVIALSLPNSHLSGPIPNELSRLQHLRTLDLSNNSINGTLPVSIFNCSDLQTLSLSSNFISGDLPDSISLLQSLQVLNISNNKFSGKVPESLASLNNLTEVSLNINYFSGNVPGGFDSVKLLDLSSNSFTGALPLEFGGANLNYLNLSHNKISGSVFPEFAAKIPATAVVDISYNKFTGEIPQMLSAQKTDYFAGNMDLCGKPLSKICTVPSSHSLPPNVSSDAYPSAAIAAIPKTEEESENHSGRKVNSWKIIAIVVGDVAAMMTLVVIFFYAHQFRKKKTKGFVAANFDESKKVNESQKDADANFGESSVCSCFGGGTEDESSETATLSESVGENEYGNDRCLVMVDGETELEMETLLKASAYILGSSGGSIVYKAVVGGGGGESFAVRRMGECGVEKMKDFEKIVRAVGRLRHRNLVKVIGFYWGEEEKLVIYDYVSNGSLAAAAYEKVGSSSCHLTFEIRLKIAKGIAKGLSYIHEKKHVHGNLKPNNILLTPEMDPVISDFGLDWLISGKTNYAADKSTRNFGSKRSTSSRDQETITSRNHHPTGSQHGCMSPYQAPESMNTMKSNQKWDVYSFGIILLELFSGKVFSDKELALLNTESTITDMETKILKITNDQFITTMDVHGRKDCFLTCLKLGFSCASLVPHKRPSMKEALQVLDKIPCPS